VPILSRVGVELPLHATGVGKVLLAFLPEDRQEKVIADGLTPQTSHTIVDAGRLRLNLAEIRRVGYAVTREEMTLGSCSVAAPIRDSEQRVVAAISLVARNSTADLRRLTPAVLTAARALSRDVAAHLVHRGLTA
jgi:DNA-binding IclR family transcriptional regulator